MGWYTVYLKGTRLIHSLKERVICSGSSRRVKSVTSWGETLPRALLTFRPIPLAGDCYCPQLHLPLEHEDGHGNIGSPFFYGMS